MKQNAARTMFLEIMTTFAEQTGLSPASESPRRYLWTDAFAVSNFLALYRQTGDEKYRHLALRLIDQVHSILGRHRKDDVRTGWISGLDEEEGRIHPTKGGLRIGKALKERRLADLFDERLEWDRDGQYYHYLTKWMHALSQTSRVTGASSYNRWGIELAKTAHAGFSYVPLSGGQKRLFWKMSIDLSYPLVESMGHHDPLDGLITYSQLQARAANGPEGSAGPDLRAEIADMAGMCEGKNWATDDALGLGGLLCDACRAAQLIIKDSFENTELLGILLDASLTGLRAYERNNSLTLPAEYRLAFRELGLSIGLRAVAMMHGLIEEHPSIFHGKHSVQSQIEALKEYAPLIERIESFWLEASNREADSWAEHRDINGVMLATSLFPDEYLTI
jgi:hypothetical protein